MKISELNEADKPREKALANGIESLTDAELLAILMGTGQPGTNVVELAQKMLGHCDNRLERFARMSVAEMMREFHGVGRAKAVTIKAALTLGSRAKSAEMSDARTMVFSSPKVVYDYMWDKLSRIDHEEFHVLLLSRAATLKSRICVSRGGTAATVVDVKIVMRHAVEHLADSMILVHNHPSGTLRPSPQDDDLTDRIAKAGKLFGIPVRDHLIVTARGYYSYHDEGRL